MTLKKLLVWIGTTLLLGAISSIVLGLLLGWTGSSELPKLLLTGLTFAAVAELGFFSYLVFNWLARELIKSGQVFTIVQILLILILLGDLLYLNVSKFTGAPLWKHLLVPLVILLVSLLVAGWKTRQGNRQSLVPTLFFMIVVTTLESIPSINSKAGELPLKYVLYTILILLLCNAYQILLLSWLVKKK